MAKRTLALLAGWVLLACASGGPPGPEDTGYSGTFRVVPDPVRIDDTVVGCSRTLTLLLENAAADAPLTLTGATCSNSDLRLPSTFPWILAPGERRGLEVQFAPSKAGEWSASIDFTTAEEGSELYALAVSAQALEAPVRRAALPPLDLVFVLDVSTTMDEMAQLRGAIERLFDSIEAEELDVRFGLTTFVNDVIVHRDGAFLDRETFFEEFDSQLVAETWVPDPSNARQLVNFDFAENSLAALHRSATEFPFRPGSRRTFLLMTDASFEEPPAVFSDGTQALYGFEEVAATLEERDIRLFSVHASEAGQGLSAAYRDSPSLVARSRGTWFELADVSSGRLPLDTLLADLLIAPECE